jgi:predicted NAD/FAD-dependent oxidoreductase
VRAAARRLEAEPVSTPPAAASSDAIIAAGKWIAGAVVLGAALIGGAIAFF